MVQAEEVSNVGRGFFDYGGIGLAVAAGALVVSVGVFILVTKVANAIEGMGGGGDDS